MLKLYHLLFYCFYNAKKWNPGEKNTGRSVLGVTFVTFNLANTSLFLIISHLQLKPNGYVIGLLGLIFMCLFYRFTLNYFKDRIKSHPGLFDARKVSQSRMTILAALLLFGSFFLLGLTGKYLSKTRKSPKAVMSSLAAHR